MNASITIDDFGWPTVAARRRGARKEIEWPDREILIRLPGPLDAVLQAHAARRGQPQRWAIVELLCDALSGRVAEEDAKQIVGVAEFARRRRKGK